MPVEPVESFKVLPGSPNLLIGSTIRLTPYDLSGELVADSGVKWSTSNPGVVAVDATGRITGIAMGTGTIRAMTDAGFAETVATVVGEKPSLEAGSSTTCAIATGSGDLYCWGNNAQGEAAIGDTMSIVTAPRKAAGALTFSSVALTSWLGCGTTTSGLHCWGMNHRGQLGIGSTGPIVRQPTPVVGGSNFVAVSVASTSEPLNQNFYCLEIGCSARACAITSAGSVSCWGNSILVPTATGIPKSFHTIEVGLYHTCGIDNANVPYCWGGGRYHEAPGPLIGGTEPPTIAGNLRFQAISTSSHVCGLNFDGDVYCWGAGGSGQLGSPVGTEQCVVFLGAYEPCRANPARVETDYKFISISTGGAHTCGVATTLQVICWGFNGNGRLGVESISATQVPTPVSTNLRFRAVKAGASHTCAIAMDGDTYCWGSNSSGQLGNGTTVASTIPVRVNTGVKFR